MIAEASIEEIKQRANLIELVSDSTSLRRQGAGYVGLCPFHNEKTPSFHIRDNGRFYHCFGCGASGNAISYVMLTKGISFPEALELLAEKYSIVLVNTNKKNVPKENVIDKNKFYAVNKLVLQFYRSALAKAPAAVNDYLKQRGLNPKAIEAFSIGLAPAEWAALANFLKGKGVPQDVLLKLGLCRLNQQGELYDTFRGRLIFPIWNDSRNVSGFGGRLIPALHAKDRLDDLPKYINSPESPVYHKSKTFFGLPQALDAIRKQKSLYIVEGYMDVVGLWSVNIQNALATCGTALTENHARRLSFLCQRVSILFDGDNAGKAAASKSFATFLNSGIDVDVLFLPKGDDPDSLSLRLKDDTTKYLADLPRNTPVECYIDALLARFSVDNVSKLGAALKGQVCSEISQLINKVKNPIEKDELFSLAAFKLRIDVESLRANQFSSQDENQSKLDKIVVESNFDKDTSTAYIESVEKLPRIDQEVLLAVMGLKEQIIDEVLKDADLCLFLSASARSFVLDFSEIAKNISSEREEKRQLSLKLLNKFGPSWSDLWKKSHEMLKNSHVNLRQAFEQCQARVKKDKIIQSLSDLDRMMLASQDEPTKLELAQQRVMLHRQLSAL